MLEEKATVLTFDSGVAELSTSIKTTCGSCNQYSHCGTGALARYLAPKPENLKIATNLELKPGQTVLIAMSENLLLRMAFLMYFVPILLLAATAITVQLLLPDLHELVIVLAAISVISSYFVVFKFWWLRRGSGHWQPEIVKVVSEPINTPVIQL